MADPGYPSRPPRPDHDAHLRVDDLRTDLRGRTIRSSAFVLASQGGRFVINLAATALLARLLVPADFGVVMKVVAVTGVIQSFTDLGLSTATIQSPRVSHGQVTALFWANILLGVLAASLIAAAAPLIAWFYQDPSVQPLVLGYAAICLISSGIVQHRAILRRRMRFAEISTITVVSLFLGALGATIAAWLGAGPWAIVLQQGITQLTTLVAFWLVCSWRPGFPRRGVDAWRMLSFGGWLAGANVIGYARRTADQVLLGKFLGDGMLGLYNRSFQILLLPLQQINAPISAVAIPSMSRLQDDPAAFRRFYRRVLNAIAHTTLPITAVMTAQAEEVVLVLLGPQWVDAIPIFTALGFAAWGQTLTNSTSWVVTSHGLTRRMFVWEAMITPVVIGSAAIGLIWGVQGVAIAVAISSQATRLPSTWYAFRGLHLKVSDFVSATARPAALSVCAGLAAFAVHLATKSWPEALTLVAGSATAGAVYLALAALWPQARAELVTLSRLRSELRRARARAEPATTEGTNP